MHFVYVDDSGDRTIGVFSALAIPDDQWNAAFQAIRSYRHALAKSDGIYVHKEFHAWKFVSRLTNAFSKKAENLAYSIALDFMHHNFCRKHQTLKTTPARAAGIEYRTWAIRDIVELLPAACHSRQF